MYTFSILRSKHLLVQQYHTKFDRKKKVYLSLEHSSHDIPMQPFQTIHVVLLKRDAPIHTYFVYSTIFLVRYHVYMAYTCINLAPYSMLCQKIIVQTPGGVRNDLVNIATMSDSFVSFRLVHHSSTFHLECQAVIAHCK